MTRFVRILGSFLVAMIMSVAALQATASNRGTADEAKALVKRAIEEIKAVGPEKAFAEFNDKNGKFVDRDLYIFVRSMDGNTVSHGANMGMIGHTSLALKDADGKLYNKEMIELASTKGSGWVDYRWVNPVEKQIQQKSSYIEKVGDYVVGAGFYK